MDKKWSGILWTRRHWAWPKCSMHVYMNVEFYSAQGSDGIMSTLQFLETLKSSAWINNPKMPSNEDFSQRAKQLVETSPQHQDKLDSMIFQVFSNLILGFGVLRELIWFNIGPKTGPSGLWTSSCGDFMRNFLSASVAPKILSKSPKKWICWKENRSGKRREQILNTGVEREGNNPDESREQRLKAVGNFWG